MPHGLVSGNTIVAGAANYRLTDDAEDYKAKLQKQNFESATKDVTVTGQAEIHTNSTVTVGLDAPTTTLIKNVLNMGLSQSKLGPSMVGSQGAAHMGPH